MLPVPPPPTLFMLPMMIYLLDKSLGLRATLLYIMFEVLCLELPPPSSLWFDSTLYYLEFTALE